MSDRNRGLAPWLIFAVAFFVANLGSMLYSVRETDPSDLFLLLSAVMPAGAFVYWFWSYLDRHRVPPPFDTGLFLSMAWFLMVPVFVLRAGRWRGVLALGGLVLVYAGAYLAAAALVRALF